ncbi:hypothetical protein [Pseudogulbenkiania subflava]|uniref:Uncharacterized protein n=1 Tax=Pseudogulbenkiania subflava DSM 22618 TaxID=1123014 RepID=A0A1Y6BNH8_9NEIS|nr:hypothetical protein [Pseudogulbenkiania subflava]SMF12727.1 hypothetical protein SAMN02745746_01443 [Pseudogulbenkiania subflava DSM 22618]
MSMVNRIAALIMGLTFSLWAHADNWLGEYILVPNDRMQQVYDEQGKEITMVTVSRLQEGMGMQLNFMHADTVPVKMETDGKTLRDWLGGNSNNIRSQALIGDKVALIRIAKGKTLVLENGRSHTMRSDYLLILPGVDLELEKRPGAQ